MKVLMLGWEFPPAISGGLGTACHGLTRAMDARGKEASGRAADRCARPPLRAASRAGVQRHRHPRSGTRPEQRRAFAV